VWLTFGECLAAGDTVKALAERCGVAVSTAFRWLRRFLDVIESSAGTLRGIVEADQTCVLASGSDQSPGSKATDRSIH
jgi:transposase-like protein